MLKFDPKALFQGLEDTLRASRVMDEGVNSINRGTNDLTAQYQPFLQAYGFGHAPEAAVMDIKPPEM